MAQPVTVLMIDDERPIRRFVRATLTGRGMKFLEAETGKAGLALAASHQPDLILLDLGLPDIDGLGVMRQLREWTQTPVIVLSARGKERDKVNALDAGADDYLTKPFGVEELVARMRVCLRHAVRLPAADEPIFETGALRVDLAKREVFLKGQAIHLTPIEYKLLTLLVKHAGKVVTQKQMLSEVWGTSREDQAQYLHVYIHQLRQKLEPNPVQPKYLVTEAGVGYRLKEDA